MAIIYTYPEINQVEGEDLLLISDTSLYKRPTRSITIDNLATYIGTTVGVVQNLQSVLTVGNTYVSADGYGTFTLNDTTNNNGNIKYVNTDEGWGYFLNAEEGFFLTDGAGVGKTSLTRSSVTFGNASISTLGLTGDRIYTLPDINGTIALISDIPSPGPSGSGTTNYTARWTSASALGIGTLYDNGTNVGIGTTSPSQKLHVDGNARVTGAYYDSGNTPGTANQLLASTVTGTAWIDPSTIVAEAATLVLIACKNTSGAAIAKGTPVYQTGNVGATATIEIAPADALISANKLPAIGLLQTDLNNGGFGNVVITGELTNFTTSPIDGVVPNPGDKVFVKSGGGLTLTKPTGEGNGIQNMGLVGKVSSGNSGSITVSSIMRTNDVPNLPEGRIWIGDGNTIVSDTVYVDEPNLRLGIGTTSPNYTLDVEGEVRILNTIESDPFTVQTPYDRVGKFISTDAGAFLCIQDSSSTNNGNGINVTGDTLTFTTASAGRLDISSTGAVKFRNYDSTNNTGTPTYLLGTDASGNIVKTNTVTENLGVVTSSLYATWTGLVKPYFNFINGNTFIVPYDTININTNINGDVPYTYVNTSSTDSAFTIIATGNYKVSINAHFYDQFGDIDVVGGVYNNTTNALLSGLIDQKDVTGNTDSNWFGQNVVNITAGTNIDIRLLFSGGSGQSPFPSSTGLLYNSILIERIN